MRIRPFENKIVIVGADHHNTLAAIRAFGEKNCDVVVIVHGQSLERKRIQILSSRYINKRQVHLIDNNADQLLEKLSQYGDTVVKSVLFPCSDFAEMVFDKNAEWLKEYFVVPGFLDNPGHVCDMMDKWEQYLFAQKYKIPMASTYLMSLTNDEVPAELSFPCIMKPRASVNGPKADIRVCNNREELKGIFDRYKAKGYNEVLVQDFIYKDYEANSLGFVIAADLQKAYVGAIAVKIREQLESATSYAIFVGDMNSSEILNEEKYRNLVSINYKIVQLLLSEGYSGHYDIDYLICGDVVYLNEINFRHSGNGYSLVNRFINAPFLWACGMLKCQEFKIPEKCVNIGTYFMAELYDKMYLNKHCNRESITISQWIKDISKTDTFAVFSGKDLKSTFRIYWDEFNILKSRIRSRCHKKA